MGRLVGSEGWEELGHDKLGALSELLEWQAYDIRLVRWLTGGRSGLPVALVERSGSAFTDKVAIKFFDAPDKVSKWQEASRLCPEEFKAHIAKSSEPLGNKTVCFLRLEIAGDDITRYRPLRDIPHKTGQDLEKACRFIVNSILGEWNSEAPNPNNARSVSAAEYFEGIFDLARIAPGNLLYQWLESSRFEPSATLIWRTIQTDEMLPNPLSLISWLNGLSAEPRLQARYGRAHGDLHLGNILMPHSPLQPAKYILIDLDNYSTDAPLARDPMYLLLSVAADWLREITPGSNTSHQLIDAIVKPPGDIPALTEYGKICRAVHEQAYLWGKVGGRGDDWTQQSMLSLAACSLRYASRELDGTADPNATRSWFYELAAVAVRRYLQETELWELYRSQERNVAPALSRPASGFKLEKKPEEDCPKTETAVTPNPSDCDARQNLLNELRAVDFDSSDRHIICARTRRLRALLSEDRAAHLELGRRINELLSNLEQTLREICSPPTKHDEFYATRIAAERYISWIVDLIEE